jgi:hypothetical protein
MQNKANFRKAQMNATPCRTRDYDDLSAMRLRKNKANSKPIKANLWIIRANSWPASGVSSAKNKKTDYLELIIDKCAGIGKNG